MKIKQLMILSLISVFLFSCEAPKLGYFQDVKSGDINQLSSSSTVKLEPGDKLSILVSSKSPQLAYLFNLPIVSHYDTSTSSDLTLGSSRVANYRVDNEGNIQFPVVGPIHVAGLTRTEVSKKISDILVKQDLLKDATVTVEFLDLYYSVMGEVLHPGRFTIDHDKATLLDALSRAGDLTIYGKRENVLVVREENGQQVSYRIDLTNAKELYSSPAFYLKQYDIIYVEPNDKRARESTALGNTLQNPSLWISAASLLTSISVLVFK